MDGGNDSGRIYNAYTFRVVPVAAPTMDEALTLISATVVTVDETCFTYTDAFTFFDAQSGGLWNTADTEYGSQIRFRDGIY